MLSQDSFSPTSGESFHLIVDNSGSMSDASKAHIDGARELIGELPEGVLVTYSCFNRTVSIGQRLGRDEILRRLERPVCTGATSLYDAIVLAVAHEEERPMQQTTIVVVTDGVDTSSTRGIDDARRAVDRVNAREMWNLLFLGTSQDAVQSAAAFGVPVQRALTFGNERATYAYRALSRVVSDSRTGSDVEFTQVHRQESMGTSQPEMPSIRRQHSMRF